MIKNAAKETPRMKKKLAVATLALLALHGTTASACDDDADVASDNLSKAADIFEIVRRIVFYNVITGVYMLVIEGRCAIEDEGNQLEVTCKLGKDAYKKHFLGLSDNVTYFAEQVDDANVSVDHYRVSFKPEAIIPDIQKQ
jgi:hypothetical protein